MKISTLLLLPLFAMLCHAATDKSEMRVALVFDDGPVPADAGPLVALLKREGVPATFSLVGTKVEQHPETAKMIVDAGNEVVNHSQTHSHPASLNDAAIEVEVNGAQRLISAATGKAPRWYWLPFLEKDTRIYATAKRAHLVVYEPHHLVVSKDYDTSVPAAEIYRLAITDVADGSVILFHEWRKDTLAQLPAILAELRRQHCRFLTFSELADSLAAAPAGSK